LSIYLYKQSDLKSALFFPDKECFTDIGKYLKLGIPTMIMTGLDVWALEIMTFMSGYLSTNDLAAQTLLANAAIVLYTVPIGINYAATSLVGQ
jgi:Na+-driven multidrug efflux pump